MSVCYYFGAGFISRFIKIEEDPGSFYYKENDPVDALERRKVEQSALKKGNWRSTQFRMRQKYIKGKDQRGLFTILTSALTMEAQPSATPENQGENKKKDATALEQGLGLEFGFGNADAANKKL